MNKFKKVFINGKIFTVNPKQKWAESTPAAPAPQISHSPIHRNLSPQVPGLFPWLTHIIQAGKARLLACPIFLPPPPILPALGKVTDKAKAVATAASTAFPPARKIFTPISDAKPDALTTIPFVP